MTETATQLEDVNNNSTTNVSIPVKTNCETRPVSAMIYNPYNRIKSKEWNLFLQCILELYKSYAE